MSKTCLKYDKIVAHFRQTLDGEKISLGKFSKQKI